jgi:serine/threonine protein kinase
MELGVLRTFRSESIKKVVSTSRLPRSTAARAGHKTTSAAARANTRRPIAETIHGRFRPLVRPLLNPVLAAASDSARRVASSISISASAISCSGRDVYVLDLETGQTTLETTRMSDGDSGSADISGDGRFVVFASEAGNLTEHRPVALKFLPSPFADDEGRMGRFVQEARSASSLNHPNILTVYEVGQTSDGAHYFATELVDGVTLRELMTSRRLKLADILDVAIQASRRSDHGTLTRSDCQFAVAGRSTPGMVCQVSRPR